MLSSPLILLASLSVIGLSGCASQNGTSRYGGEPIVDCGPVNLPCAPAAVYRPVPMQAPPPVYVPAPLPVQPAAPVYEPEPYTAKPSVPVVSAPQPYTPEPYTSEPYSAEPYTSEPYTPPLPPLRDNRPVVDDPAELPCPEGSIPGYGGKDCIPISIPRK